MWLDVTWDSLGGPNHHDWLSDFGENHVGERIKHTMTQVFVIFLVLQWLGGQMMVRADDGDCDGDDGDGDDGDGDSDDGNGDFDRWWWGQRLTRESSPIQIRYSGTIQRARVRQSKGSVQNLNWWKVLGEMIEVRNFAKNLEPLN